MAFTENQSAVAELYIAALGRSPEKGGLDYWVGELEGGRKTLSEIQDNFFDTNLPEVAARFPEGTTSTQFVESIYVNVFGRASDEGGLAYWSNRLDLPASDENHLSTSTLMSTMLQIAKDPANFIDGAVLADNLSDAEVAYTNGYEYILSASDSNIVEGTPYSSHFSSYTDANISLKLDTPAIQDISVNYEVLSSSTANINEDYTSLLSNGTIIFYAGTSVNSLDFNIVQDSNFESDESINIRFSGNNIENTTSIINILNDDSMPIVQEEYYINTSGTTDASNGDYKFIITPDNYTHTIYNLDEGDTLKYNSSISSSSTSIYNSTGTINYTDGSHHTTIELVNVINYDMHGM